MKGGPSRAVVGNVLVMALLAMLAWWLLRLHLQEDWWLGAPLASHWRWAAGSLAAYTALCTLLWWRGRTRDDAGSAAGEAPTLLVWASQTGFAQQLCERSAEVLRAAGLPVRVRGLHQVDAAVLQQTTRLLLIASTTGEGDPPDHTLPFLRRVMPQDLALPQLHYGVLALGDRSYGHFCAFGHQLDAWLRQHGAHPLFDTVEVDNADPAALRHWQQLLGQLGGNATELPDWAPAQYQPWQLQARRQENPGSPGAATWRVSLVPADGVLPAWQAGDVAEIGPQHSPAEVDAWLATHARDGAAVVEGKPLREWLARSHLPVLPDAVPADEAALVAALKPLPHREYSIASMPTEGEVLLLLRRLLRPDGTPGLGSGWLCDHAALGGRIDLRFRSNPNFHAPAFDAPLILIGNGTGIAGLRAHLRESARSGKGGHWLLFGERSATHDAFFRDEIEDWLKDGTLARFDAAWSRDDLQPCYVQHLLQQNAAVVQAWVTAGAAIMVCGSLEGMALGVGEALSQAVGSAALEALVDEGRYRRDVY